MIYSAVGKSDSVTAVDNTTAGTQRTAEPFRSEHELEAAIEAAKQRMCAATDRTLKLQFWREMCRLIDQRSPGRVRFMERTRGLA